MSQHSTLYGNWNISKLIVISVSDDNKDSLFLEEICQFCFGRMKVACIYGLLKYNDLVKFLR